MAINFEFYENPDPTGENPEKYHARTVIMRKVSTKEICKEIQYGTSLTIGDVKAVLSALSNSLAYHMGESHQVHLEGIGYFKPTLKYTREIIPAKTRAQSVWFKSVNYKADKDLYSQLAGVLTVRSPLKNHSAKQTDEEINRKVAGYLKSHEYITRTDVQQVCGLTKSTALRHIRRMLAEGKIRNMHTKRQPLYVLS